MQTQMWHDPVRKLVVYDTPHVEQIVQMVPEAKRLNDNLIAMPTTTYNFQILCRLGLPTLPPLEIDNYDFPGRYKPWASQRLTANFLVTNPRSFCLSDMGTGKTLAALWAADYLMHLHHGLKCLIVAPLSTLSLVWADTIFANLLGRRTHRVLHGSRSKRRSLLAEPADFYIINPEGLDVLNCELDIRARPDIGIVIIDEASMYKNRGIKRHAVARKVIVPRPYVWAITATPAAKSPVDAYGVAKLVNNCHGESYASFQHRTMMRVSQFTWRPRLGADEAVKELLQPAIRFSIKDCADLPPCTTQRRHVELSQAQIKAFKELKRDYVLLTKEGNITANNEAVLRMKFIQISCGAIYGDKREIINVDAAPRIKELRKVMEQCKEKIIIFAPLTSVLSMLYKELSDYSCAVVRGSGDGGPSNKERNQILQDFMSTDKPRVLLAHPSTMSHGLTLTKASTIIWFAPTDSTELYLQANKRIDRPGQVNSTTIVQLTSTKIETDIYRRLEENETLQGSLLALVEKEV